MHELTVDLGTRAYPIHIGAGLLGNAELYKNITHNRRLLVVTNDTIAPLYLQQVCETLNIDSSKQLVLPDGESHKTLGTMTQIYDKLLAGNYARDCVIIALGGGVIGDITGFAAASYQRGVDFIQIPTTLLAQVDSSVGGKTGVNHPLGKNMIGAFHQPRLVLADTDTLISLPERELAAGLAEVIKYGLIRDTEFLAWLENNMPRLLKRKPDALAYAITRSCENKAEVVAADERESGQRALLNLGHTFGHAIEAAMGYGEWLHGEAVAAGMCMAADMSVRLGWLTEAERDRAKTLIAAAGLPTAPPQGLTREQMLGLMASDKKVLAGKLRLVLLRSLGEAVVTSDFDEKSLLATLDASLG